MQRLIGQWSARRSQSNPTSVTVRPLQPDDASLIYAMHGRLSPESIYYRYLQHRPPTLDAIATLYRLDPATGAGFVATVQQQDEIIVGVACYVRETYTEPPTAELGILVEDRFQGQGVGRRLWQRIQRHAQTHQIHQLRVLVHPGNQRMQRLLRGSGLSYTTSTCDGVHEYLVALDLRSHSALPHPVPAETTPIEIGPSPRDQLAWY